MVQALTVYQPKSPIPLERQLARRVEQDVAYYLTAEEIERMLTATTKPRDRMLLKTFWHSGGRISEVVQLRRCDFDYHHLKLANLKRRRPSDKLVYVSAEYARDLAEYCEQAAIGPNGYLFPAKTSGRPISDRMARRIFYQAAARAGVSKVKDGAECLPWPHLARHGHCIHLLRHGTPLRIVQKQLGHASLLTTERYMVFSEADRAAFVGRAMSEAE